MHSLEDWLIRSYELGDLPKTIEREMVYRAPAWYTRMKASGKLKAEIERLTGEPLVDGERPASPVSSGSAPAPGQ